MNRRGLQPLGVVVSSFRLLKSFHLLPLRKQFTERIIHYPHQASGLAKRPNPMGSCSIWFEGYANATRRGKGAATRRGKGLLPVGV